MYQLSPDRKLYLLRQNRDARSAPDPPKIPGQQHAASYGPSSATALLPRLVPQLTGDAGLMRRFSITGWGSGSVTPPVVPIQSNQSDAEFDTGSAGTHGKGKLQMEKGAAEVQPLQPQSTGGLWSSWWTSSGGEKVNSKETANPVKWYVEGIRSGKAADAKLVKHLISLRVHLSTANLAWINEFVGEEKGLDALSVILASLVGKGGKSRILNEAETSNLLEVIKCLRVLLNTEVSSRYGLVA